MEKKTSQRNFRLTEFEVSQLKMAARFKANGNESMYLRHIIWRDFLDALGSPYYGDVFTPQVFEAVINFAHSQTLKEPPLCTTAERWLELLSSTVNTLAADPYTYESKALHKALTEAIPVAWLVAIPQAANAAAEAFSRLTGFPIPDEFKK